MLSASPDPTAVPLPGCARCGEPFAVHALRPGELGAYPCRGACGRCRAYVRRIGAVQLQLELADLRAAAARRLVEISPHGLRAAGCMHCIDPQGSRASISCRCVCHDDDGPAARELSRAALRAMVLRAVAPHDHAMDPRD